MFRTKLALIASLFFLTLSTGCLTDETETIDPSAEDQELERDNDDDRGGDDDEDNGCRYLKNDGGWDCPTE